MTQYDLTVEDGGFLLEAGQLLVSGSGNRIAGTCQVSGSKPGIRVVTTGDIDVVSQGEIVADCTLGGGLIELRAGGDLTQAGKVMTANAAAGPGGAVILQAAGGVSVSAGVEARRTGSTGIHRGGEITIKGETVSVTASLTATGVGNSGGNIHVEAAADLTVASGGTVDASGTSGGDGGEVVLEAGGTLTCSRPVWAKGNGATSAAGSITLTGSTVTIDNNLVASGGAAGGDITVDSWVGPITVGQGGTSTLDVTRSSNNAGDGGDLTLTAHANHITIGQYGTLDASGASSGDGGQIELIGVDVTAVSGAAVLADSGTSGTGGEIWVHSRGALDLSGSVSASNGGMIDLTHREASPELGSLTCPASDCDIDEVPDLPAACGDGRLAVGDEDCDDWDLDGQNCTTVPGTYTGGTLACASDCTFDTAGCTQ